MTGAKWNAQGPGVESQPLPLCREELSFHRGGGGDVGQRRLVPAQMDKEAASDLFSKHPSPPPVSQSLLPWRQSRQPRVSRKD